jgi:hypothetical protein
VIEQRKDVNGEQGSSEARRIPRFIRCMNPESSWESGGIRGMNPESSRESGRILLQKAYEPGIRPRKQEEPRFISHINQVRGLEPKQKALTNDDSGWT